MTTSTATRYVSQAEAARRLGVSESTVRRLRADGQLDSKELPSGRVRIPEEALDRVLSTSSVELTAQDRLEAAIRKAIEHAPPLTDDQRARIVALLGGA